MKKGFTLIELLAVIVILAVITLITVPMIRNVIEDTRKGAFKDSVMSAFHEVEYYLLENNLSEIQEDGIEVTSLKLDNNEFEYGIIIQNGEGELEAINVSDGKYCASGAMTALEVHKGECDAEAPKAEVSVEGKVATINLSDNIGVIAYAVTKKDEEVTDWIEIEETTEITETYEATEAGDYTAWVKDKYGKVSSQDFTINQSAFCAYAVNDTWNFTYKGQVEEWTVPCDGTYQLEVWGAQGGASTRTTGGKGGKTYGNKTLTKNTVLYIVVGGQGVSTGGYNGGGASSYGGGGGATHIATVTGELSTLSSNRNAILIVAGGGGGGGTVFDNMYNCCTTSQAGGSGGGASGGAGIINYKAGYSARWPIGSGGTANAEGTGSNAGSFGTGGIGMTSTYPNNGGGGGSGWYGGGSGYYYNNVTPGGGGSGYLNTAQLIPNTTGMSSGVQSGNGQAKITLVSLTN